jgi:diketogulonate reductase-like aldo/keto reductase
MQTIRLNEKANIPVMGLGTWQLTGDVCTEAVRYALELGYKHIDTADVYGNHAEVAGGIKASGAARDSFFLTTKVWRTDLAHDPLIESADRFLEELHTDYIDLLLIHWPNKDIPVEASLRAMEELRRAGKVHAIGVSNFTVHHLEDALQAGAEITNNQVEIRPAFAQKSLREYCASKNISITAYSSLRGGATELPVIMELAEKYGKTPSQVVLNWIIARGMIAIPKSSRPERIKENFESTGFEMEGGDLARIDALPEGERVNAPAFGEFDY